MDASLSVLNAYGACIGFAVVQMSTGYFTLHLSICFTLVLDGLLLYVCTYLAAVLNSLFAR